MLFVALITRATIRTHDGGGCSAYVSEALYGVYLYTLSSPFCRKQQLRYHSGKAHIS